MKFKVKKGVIQLISMESSRCTGDSGEGFICFSIGTMETKYFLIFFFLSLS